jgi:hypothetical protein
MNDICAKSQDDIRGPLYPHDGTISLSEIMFTRPCEQPELVYVTDLFAPVMAATSSSF